MAPSMDSQTLVLPGRQKIPPHNLAGMHAVYAICWFVFMPNNLLDQVLKTKSQRLSPKRPLCKKKPHKMYTK